MALAFAPARTIALAPAACLALAPAPALALAGAPALPPAFAFTLALASALYSCFGSYFSSCSCLCSFVLAHTPAFAFARTAALAPDPPNSNQAFTGWNDFGRIGPNVF